MIARWIDLGCPINTGTGDDANYGWFLDELRPTVTVSSPRPNRNDKLLTEIRVGVADAYTGLNSATLSIKADFPVNGVPAGTELKSLGSFVAPGVFSIPLQTPFSNRSTNHVTASVADRQGNTNVVTVRFWVDTGFRIVSLDASGLNSQRFTIRVENREAATNHAVYSTTDLTKPGIEWTPLTILNAADEPNRIRRIDVSLPGAAPGNVFLRMQRP
jgi:hypothetical protein